MNFLFILNSIALGVGLAMDAFSVSIANGLNEPHMSRKKMCGIAGTYAGYQFAMPMIGWFCVHAIARQFRIFQKFIPWIALILLAYIGGSMLLEGIRRRPRGDREEDDVEKLGVEKGFSDPTSTACPDSARSEEELAAKDYVREGHLGFGTLMLQGLATSIDALSVGFTISEYGTLMAFTSSLIIAAVTFCICMTGLVFGRRFGTKLSDKASILGGLILIGIGLEIFISGVF